jgi:hypothetical protein
MKKLTTILTLAALNLSAAENRTKLKPDEQIVFYPTVAQRVPGETNLWRAQIRGCVFEVEKRHLLVAAFEEAMELKTEEMTSAQSVVFAERARLFLVDHERGKKIFVHCGTNEFFVGKSSADGTFGAEVLLRDLDLNQTARQAGAPFVAVLRPGDPRIFSGAVFPLAAEGVSVISDIDDTIKITEVRDKQATLRNTFLREFQAVPGMAEWYQALTRSPLTRPSATLSPSDGERDGVRGRSEHSNAPTNTIAFHYISASPWQLYEPLAALVASNGFPAGTFTLKEFRWKNRTFFSLFASPEKYKPGVIEPLLKQFPKRKFILIGDSGERDPEIYGALARKFPAQILHIYIRDVTNEDADAERYQKAFRAVPRAKWQIFRDPAELPPPPPSDLAPHQSR